MTEFSQRGRRPILREAEVADAAVDLGRLVAHFLRSPVVKCPKPAATSHPCTPSTRTFDALKRILDRTHSRKSGPEQVRNDWLQVFKITAAGGSTAPNSTDTMKLTHDHRQTEGNF